MERRLGFMKKNSWFKLLSLAGVILAGLGTVLSGLADACGNEAMIEEKVDEALAKREEENEEEEES